MLPTHPSTYPLFVYLHLIFSSLHILVLLSNYVYNNIYHQKLCWMAAAAVETGNVPSLASVMMDAQQAFNQCAIENCREQLMAPRLREVG